MSVSKRKGILFVLPSVIGVTVFYLYPLGRTLLRSFSNGTYTYSSLIGSEAFLLAITNTGLFLLLGVGILFMMALFLAVVFQNRIRSGVSFSLLPMLLPSGVIVLFINAIAGEWMVNEGSFWGLLILYLWKNTGYCLMLLLAGLSCIDHAVLEAAKLEGASTSRIFWQIQFPQIHSFTCFGVLIAITNSFKIFRESYLLYGEQPPDSVYFLQNLMYNNFLSANDQRLAAISMLLIIGVGIPILLLLRYGGKYE